MLAVTVFMVPSDQDPAHEGTSLSQLTEDSCAHTPESKLRCTGFALLSLP